MRSRQNFALFCFLTVSTLAIFYLPFLAGQKAFYLSDITYYFEPFEGFIARALKLWRLPLWNPYLYCGMPQIAVPSPGIFYLPASCFVFLPFTQALAVYLILHQLIAGAGAYVLSLRLGFKDFAAAVTGAGAALSGYMFALTANYTLLATASWLPLALYALSGIGRGKKRADLFLFFLGMFSTAMMIAAGRPEIFLPAEILLAGFATATAIISWQQDCLGDRVLKEWLWRMAALGGGVALAMPVIAPAMEWVSLSPRAHGLELKWVMTWSANWYYLLCLVFAQPLGDLTALGNRYLSLAASRPHTIPYLSSAYVGPIIVSLAAFSASGASRRLTFSALLVLVAGLIMSAGSATPVAPFISGLSPAFSSFRYPVKLLIFPVFSLCLLAGAGANAVAEKKASLKCALALSLIWSGGAVAGAILLLFPQLSQLTLHFPWLSGQTIDMSIMKSAQLMFGNCILSSCLLGLSTSFVCHSYLSDKLPEPIFQAVILGGLLATLLCPAVFFSRHGTAPDYFERKPALAPTLSSLTEPTQAGSFKWRVLPLIFDPLTCPPTFCPSTNLPFAEGFYLFSRQLLLPNCNLDFQIPYAFGYEAAETGSFKRLFSRALSSSRANQKANSSAHLSDIPLARFCQITASRYVLTQALTGTPAAVAPLLDPRFFQLINEDRQANARIYCCRVALPRAYFASSVRVLSSAKDIEEQLLASDSLPVLETTYLEAPSGADSSSLKEIAISPTSTPEQLLSKPLKNSVSIVSGAGTSPEHISLETRSDTERLLVLCDLDYPGWRCLIDGRDCHIYRANDFCRATVVPPGKHLVEFVYQPQSLLFGFCSAVAALVSFVLLCYFTGRTAEKPAASRLVSLKEEIP